MHAEGRMEELGPGGKQYIEDKYGEVYEPPEISQSHRSGWETRWERMYEQGRHDEFKPGSKGEAYIIAKHGEVYEPVEPPYDVYEEYDDYEFDVEFTS